MKESKKEKKERKKKKEIEGKYRKVMSTARCCSNAHRATYDFFPSLYLPPSFSLDVRNYVFLFLMCSIFAFTMHAQRHIVMASQISNYEDLHNRT